MTLYKVTYRLGGSTYSANITERNEAAARKTFKKQYDGEIVAIEFQRANVQATKSQERDALEKIKQMIEELGPDSYLSIAFEGAFEDAESNIENDFGDSMKRRWEYSENTVKNLREKLEDKEREHEASAKTIERLQAEIEALRKQLLSEDDLYDIEQMIKDREYDDEHAASQAAEEIVKYADNPASTEFQSAVTNHRNLTGRANFMRQIRQRVEYAHAARHGAQ